MCIPVMAALAIASFVASAAGAVMQNQAANKQANAVNAQAAQGAENARQATIQNYAMQGLRIQQEGTAAAEQIQQNHVEMMRAQSTAVASAGTAGVNGLSVDALINDLGEQGANNDGAIEMNRDAQIAQTTAGLRGIQLQGDGAVNAQPRAQGASGASLAIGLVGAGLNAAGSYYQNSNMQTLLKQRAGV